MPENLILTDGFVWIEFLRAGINVQWMLSSGYPDPHYIVRIGYNLEDGFLLTKEPIWLRSEFDPISNVLGKFCQTRQLIDTAQGEDCNYSIIAYNYKGMCKVLFNLGLHLLFTELEGGYSTDGELAIVMEFEWDKLNRFAWQLQTEELRYILVELDVLIPEYPNRGLEEIRSRYQKKFEQTMRVVDNWDNIEIPPFSPLEFYRADLGSYDSERSHRIYEEIKRVLGSPPD